MIADVSFGHETTTGQALVRAGFTGAIGYCSNVDARKNLPAARLADWLDHGLSVGLVWEDDTTDLLTGYAGGLQRGRDFARQARAIGYDVDGCTMFAAADFNTQLYQLGTCDEFMRGFGQSVPHPAIYGNSWLIDHLVSTGRAGYGWQSNSTSYSYGPSPHAYLLQRYADPRAAGLPIDVNDVTTNTLRLMGETMSGVTLDPATQKILVEIHTMLFRIAFGLDDGQPVPYTHRGELLDLVRAIAGKPAAPTPQAIAAVVVPMITSAGLDAGDVARALIELAAAGAAATPAPVPA